MQILLPPTSESERLTNLARTLGEVDYKDWIWKQRDAEHRRRFASTAGQPSPTFVRVVDPPIFHNQDDRVNMPGLRPKHPESQAGRNATLQEPATDAQIEGFDNGISVIRDYDSATGQHRIFVEAPARLWHAAGYVAGHAGKKSDELVRVPVASSSPTDDSAMKVEMLGHGAPARVAEMLGDLRVAAEGRN